MNDMKSKESEFSNNNVKPTAPMLHRLHWLLCVEKKPSLNMTNTKGFVRLATDEDIEIIYQRLISEDTNNVHGSFLCNWNLTHKVYLEHGLFVYIDSTSMSPVGYLWHNFGIVEVFSNMRGKGIGRELVEHGKIDALNSNISVIKIKCAPETSIPFWEHMGFRLYNNKDAYFIVEKKLDVKNIGALTTVELNFYPEYKKWKPETKPLQSFKPQAIMDNKSVIYFYNRISVFTGNSEWSGDPVVEIIVGGKRIYLDKAKYPEAERLGVKKTSWAYSIEKLNLQ